MLPVTASAQETEPGSLSNSVEIPLTSFTPSNALNGNSPNGSFVNGTVTYGASGWANAYIVTDIPEAPSGFPNLHSLTFSYQGPNRLPSQNISELGGVVRVLAVNDSQATGGWLGNDAFIDAVTVGTASVENATESAVQSTITIDQEKLASLGNVSRLVLYVHTIESSNGVSTTYTYSNISVKFSADYCDGTCESCTCEGYCRFTNEGECCYAAPPSMVDADCIEIGTSDLAAVGAAVDDGEITLTAQYDDNFIYFDVPLPDDNTIYDYTGLSFSFEGVSGDNPYKTLALSAGGTDVNSTFASFTPIASGTSNGLTGSTGTGNVVFTFNDSVLREFYAADLPVVRFAINMPAALSGVAGESNVTVTGPTVFKISGIKLNSKSCSGANPCATCEEPLLSGDNFIATGEVGRHALTKFGYDYELWSQRVGNPAMAPGRAIMNIPPSEDQEGKGGIFNASWRDTHNVLIRAGRKFTDSSGIKVGTESTIGDSYADIGDVSLEFETSWFTTDNVAYLSVYGWAFFAPGSEPVTAETGASAQFSNEIEYYIVQDRKSYNPVSNARLRGSATIDGILYDFYVTDRIGQPMLTSDSGNFKQYWSVPHDEADFRQSGTVSISEHFAAWEECGMLMDGPLYEVAWKVESYTGGSGAYGYANVSKNLLTINGVEVGDTTTPETPGTPVSPTYEILDIDGIYTGKGDWGVKIDAPYEDFLRLRLNGDIVDPANYVVTEGSTIIKLKENYLNALGNGEYEFESEFAGGKKVPFKLKINIPGDSGFSGKGKNPSTGDTAAPWIAASLMFISMLMIVVLLLTGKGNTFIAKVFKRR